MRDEKSGYEGFESHSTDMPDDAAVVRKSAGINNLATYSEDAP